MGRIGLAYHGEMVRAVHSRGAASLLAAFSRSSGTGPDLTAEQPFGPDGLETPLPIYPNNGHHQTGPAGPFRAKADIRRVIRSRDPS